MRQAGVGAARTAIALIADWILTAGAKPLGIRIEDVLAFKPRAVRARFHGAAITQLAAFQQLIAVGAPRVGAGSRAHAGSGRRPRSFGLTAGRLQSREVDGGQELTGNLNFQLLQAGTRKLNPDQLVIDLQDSADAPGRHLRVPDKRVFFEGHRRKSTMAQGRAFRECGNVAATGRDGALFASSTAGWTCSVERPAKRATLII